MFSFTISGIRCRLSLLFPAVLLYGLSLDQSGLVLIGFSAAVIHECGHLLMSVVLKCPPSELIVSCFGMRMITDARCTFRNREDLGITLAGPMMNIMFGIVLCIGNVHSVAVSAHMVMGLFNLLPITPLDGGRVIRIVMRQHCSINFCRRTEHVLCLLTVIPLSCLAVTLAVQSLHNISLLLVTVYVIFIHLFHNGN